MEISINTAQNVGIVLEPAGLVRRIAATMIDLMLLGSVLLLFTTLLSPLLEVWNGTNILIAILFIVLLLYHGVCEFFFNGRSVGKMALQLRVVRLDGRKLSFWDCLLRWSLRLVDISASMGVVAMLSIIISSKMQRLGDLAAGTTVIREKTGVSIHQFSLYDTPDDYRVVFPQVAMLTDKDISIIKEIMREVENNSDYKLLAPLTFLVKTLTVIQTVMNNLVFMQTVLKDYIHLTKQ